METKPDSAFKEFLIRKNIDPESFRSGSPAQFEDWRSLFVQVHEESFLMLRKFELNPVRRRFTLNPIS